jgi:hypothetical protein
MKRNNAARLYRLFFLLIGMVVIISLLPAQENLSPSSSGAAVTDRGLDYQVNPAALGTGRCDGFGLTYFPLGVNGELDSEGVLSR